MAILNYSEFNHSNKKAFTIVELLIVIGIAAVLFSGLVFYSRGAERQLILFKEQMKIVTAFQEAKSLAIASFFNENQIICGYGVNFDKMNNKMTIFKELPSSGSNNCENRDNIYASAEEFHEEIKLDDRIIIFGNLINSNGGIFSNVVFISPEPLTIIDDSNSEFATIEITDISGVNKKIVKITDVGQITAQ